MEIVIYGVGSPLLADVHSTLARLGWSVTAEVANVEDGPSYSRNPAIPASGLSAEDWNSAFVIPLLTPGHRKSIVQEIELHGAPTFPAVVDPTTAVADTSIIDTGAYVNAGGSIGGQVRVGSFCVINRSASIGHHSILEPFSSVGPGATITGSVTVGSGAFVGAGAVVLPGCTLGSNSIVGAGSVVLHDVAPNTVVAGNPARVVREDIIGYNEVGV